jgi:hypothetical protein
MQSIVPVVCGEDFLAGLQTYSRRPSLSARMALNSEPGFHCGQRLELPNSLAIA